MKRLSAIPVLLILAMMVGSCGGGNSGDTDVVGDTTDMSRTDSTMSVHHRDPSTAFPRPPVTGPQVDSTYVEDSVRRQE